MKIVKALLKDDVFRHGSIFFFALITYYILNFFFHFTMGRMLGPAEYGILGVLMSIIYIVTAPLTTIQTVITKFTAQFRAKHMLEEIKCLFIQSLKKMFVFSIIVTAILIIFSGPIAKFFNIADRNIIISFSLLFLVIFTLAINRGFLQGYEKFRALGLSYVLEGGLRITLAIIFVWFGWRIFGAVIALLFGFLMSFLFTLFLLKRPKKFKRVESKEIYRYSVPVLVSITMLTFIFNIDVLLIKHYMPAVEAGLYVALATLSKIIFWAGSSISFVMFPKVAERFAAGKKYFSVFKKSLVMVSAVSIIGLSIYLAIPKFAVFLLYGEQYLAIVGDIRMMALAMTFLSFSYLIINYFLAINKFKFIYFLSFVFILETILIIMDQNRITDVVMILFATNAILLLYLAVDLIKNEIIPRNSRVQRRKGN